MKPLLTLSATILLAALPVLVLSFGLRAQSRLSATTTDFDPDNILFGTELTFHNEDFVGFKPASLQPKARPEVPAELKDMTPDTASQVEAKDLFGLFPDECTTQKLQAVFKFDHNKIGEAKDTCEKFKADVAPRMIHWMRLVMEDDRIKEEFKEKFDLDVKVSVEPTGKSGNNVLKFSYVAKPKKKDDADEESKKETRCVELFWWVMDVDDYVIELQTKPISSRRFNCNLLDYVLKKHIFGFASQVEVAPHKTYGGGHISIDRKTGFPMAHMVRNFLLKFYENHAVVAGKKPLRDDGVFCADQGASIKKCQADFCDFLNQATESAYAAHVEESGDVAENKAASAFVETFKKWFMTYKKTGHVYVSDDAPLHYHFVNIEHFNEEDKKAQRIEIRGLAAQKDYHDLIEDIRALVKMIEAAKEGADILGIAQSQDSAKECKPANIP